MIEELGMTERYATDCHVAALLAILDRMLCNDKRVTCLPEVPVIPTEGRNLFLPATLIEQSIAWEG